MHDALQEFLSETSTEPFHIERNSCGVWVLRWKMTEKKLRAAMPTISTWEEAAGADLTAIFHNYAAQLGLSKVDDIQRGDVGLFAVDSRFDVRTGVSMGIAVNPGFWGFRGIRGIRFMKKEPLEVWR